MPRTFQPHVYRGRRQVEIRGTGSQSARTSENRRILGTRRCSSVRRLREKPLEFGRDTRKKGEKFYQQKSDEIADDIEEKTKRIQEELRNTGSEIYKDTSKRFNSAADDAAKEILDQ